MVAHSPSIRLQAIALHQQGMKKSQISRQLKVAYDCVQNWIRQYDKAGEKGLANSYHRCGRKSNVPTQIKEFALALKKRQENWGAPFILLHLQDRFPGAKLPTERTLQRWFKIFRLQPMRTRLPKAEVPWAKAAFERVQVDAKELLKTADGKPCCYLNFTDEYTGSELDAFVFPLCPYQRSTSATGI